jgi:hypothetical protein
MQFWFVAVVNKYMNFSTHSNDLLSVSKLWYCPTFWWRDTTIYLVFCTFTSRPTSLIELMYYSLWYSYFHSVYSHRQRRPEADAFHSIPVRPDILQGGGGDSMILRNVGILPYLYNLSQPRRPRPEWSFSFSKAANLFEISMWYCFLTSTSLGFWD